MSSGSGKPVSTRQRKGFEAADVQSFLRRGNQLANPAASNGGKNIGSFAPKERTRDDVLEGNNVVQSSGFLGEFSSFSAERLDTLRSIFTQRQRAIQNFRGQPSRSALFLARSP